MTASKVTELPARPVHDRRDCPVCTPHPEKLREDQVWGVCQTNKPHSHVQIGGIMFTIVRDPSVPKGAFRLEYPDGR